MNKFKTLDVGCGLNKDTPYSVPLGDVNCDIQKPIKKCVNFVLCDAQHLPFKSNSFNFVYSSHVIEHVDNPFLMLKELIRVSNKKIVIRTPFILWRWRKFGNKAASYHRCHFNKKWFDNAIRKLGIYQGFSIKYLHFKGFPHDFMPIIRIPVELEVKINKRQ